LSGSATKSQHRFAQLFIERLRRRGWRDAIEYDEARFMLHLGEGGALMLANAYRDWEGADEDDRDRQLGIAVASIFCRSSAAGHRSRITA
jgi:hypothetical protein